MFQDILGPIVVGYGVSAFLLGFQSLQVLIYYRKYSFQDPLLLKLLVFLVWFLELAHSMVTSAIVYQKTVTYFGDIVGPAYMPRLLSANGLMSVSIASTVQIYSAHRLYIITKTLLISLVCGGFAVLRAIFYLAMIISQSTPLQDLKILFWHIVVVSIGILTVATDTIMASALFYALWKRRITFRAFNVNLPIADSGPPKPLFQYGLEVIDQLILCCVSSNILTCIGTIIAIVLFHSQDNLAYFPFSNLSTRLYSICFVSLVLHGRSLQQQIPQIPTIPTSHSSIFGTQSMNTAPVLNRTRNVGIGTTAEDIP